MEYAVAGCATCKISWNTPSGNIQGVSTNLCIPTSMKYNSIVKDWVSYVYRISMALITVYLSIIFQTFFVLFLPFILRPTFSSSPLGVERRALHILGKTDSCGNLVMVCLPIRNVSDWSRVQIRLPVKNGITHNTRKAWSPRGFLVLFSFEIEFSKRSSYVESWHTRKKFRGCAWSSPSFQTTCSG